MGAARVFRTVHKPKGRSGSGTIGGVPLGSYVFRIVAITKHKVRATRRARVAVFGNVGLATLFPNGSKGAYPLATSTFTYVLASGTLTPGAVTVAAVQNHFRSIHLDWVPGNAFDSATAVTET